MASAHREWLVAGALVEVDGRLLMVRNRRRGGFSDWSTPGGVIDADDATLLDGLAREVEEETGIRVRRWEGPVYEVQAVAPDLGWTMRCEVHRAVEFDGELRVDDPDGIVVEAEFFPPGECHALLGECARWVAEPLGEWLAERWGPGDMRGYQYEVRGTARADLKVRRAAVS
ncbi:MAG: NUDIX hydrolase [Actinomycetota bacterium]